MTVTTFDFDNTIIMSHMLIQDNKPIFVFDGYNWKIIDIIRSHIEKRDDIHIVTARCEEKEALFPDFCIPTFLKELSLDHYLTSDRVHYTNGDLKLEKLKKLGSTLHYDDSLEEIRNNFGKIPTKSSYDYYPDSHEVGKALIYDKNNRILVLKRTDGDKRWDLPGGHVKQIELFRPNGLAEGTEREVLEETGLLLPFMHQIGVKDFTWKKKTSKITFFHTKLNENKPEVNLKMQKIQENNEFEWVLIGEMFKYVKNGTQVLREGLEMAKKEGFINEESQYQSSQKQKHRKMKEKLIGLGKNKEFGGGKGHSRPKMSRSDSAPAGFGALEEENNKKKRKIKVKIVNNLDEKRRKRRKKRRKRRKKRAKFSYYGGYFPYSIGDFGGNGGDGGGGE